MTKELDLWIKKILIVVGFMAAGYILYRIQSFVAILVISGFLTMLISPLVDTLEKKHIHPVFTILGLYAIVAIIVFIIVGTILPIVANYISMTASSVATWVNNAQVVYNTEGIRGFHFPGFIEKILGFFLSEENMQNTLKMLEKNAGALQDAATKSVSGLTSGGIQVISSVGNAFFNWMMIGITTFLLTLERKKVTKFILDVIPDNVEHYFLSHYKEIRDTLNTWIRAMLILSFSIFFLTYIGLTLTELIFGFDTENTFTLALIAGVMEFIPYVGPLIALIPALIIGLGIGWKVAIIITILYLAIQQIENNFLVPYIMSRSLDLSPVLVFIVMTIGAMLGGIMGIILAVPIAAVIRIFYISQRDKKAIRKSTKVTTQIKKEITEPVTPEK